MKKKTNEKHSLTGVIWPHKIRQVVAALLSPTHYTTSSATKKFY